MSVKSFDHFIESLSKRLKEPLPGSVAHEPLRATPIGNLIPKFEHKTNPKPGSVLILLYPYENEIWFPLIQRPIYTGAHSGQISLPGGKAEQGENIIETALREGQEEIGVDPKTISVIGQLSDFFVIPSNFLVSPIIGFTETKPSFIPDNKEVEHILQGQLSSLIQDNAIILYRPAAMISLVTMALS